MKPSFYNHFFPYKHDSDKLIAYNARSNGGALISKSDYQKYEDYISKGIPINDENLVTQLKFGYFLIDDDLDELNLIKYNMQRSRFDTRSLSMTIAPTSDCNFRCIYCYEKDVINPMYLSKEEQDRIVNFLENNIKYISTFTVTWYGGEPLLAMDIIESLSERFIKICDDNNVLYGASIITNGYLLTRKYLEKFEKLKIATGQVTLDGTAEYHDKRRPLVGKKPSFDKIFNNLLENFDLLPVISLRINTDRENIESGQKILQKILDNNMMTKINPYLGRVITDNDCYEKEKCFSLSEFSAMDYDFFTQEIKGVKEVFRYPEVKSNYCGADRLFSFVINAAGSVYKCWSDLGQENKLISKNLDEFNNNNEVYMNYMMYDPTEDTRCKTCNILPLCMGGCPYRISVKDEDRCVYLKDQLEKYLNHAYKVQIENKDLQIAK